MNKTHVRIADFVLIAALVAVAFLPWIFLRGKPAKSVAVVLDGKTVQTMICQIPAQHKFLNEIQFVLMRLPIVHRPIAEIRQGNIVLFQKILCILNGMVYQ